MRILYGMNYGNGYRPHENDGTKNKNTLVSGNAGDEKNLHRTAANLFFLTN